MKLSERMERLFSYAKSTWKDPPPCPFNRDFQYAAVNLFSDKEVWERLRCRSPMRFGAHRSSSPTTTESSAALIRSVLPNRIAMILN